METKKKKFIGSPSPAAGLKGPLAFFWYPVDIGGVVEIAMLYLFLPPTELLLIILPGIWGMVLNDSLGWAPWYLHFATIGLFLYGLIKPKRSQEIRGYLGLDPAFLRMYGVERDASSFNNPLYRGLAFLFFSVWLATLVNWLRFIEPLDYVSLGVRGNVGPANFLRPFVSFLDTWIRFAVANYYGQWITWFVGTLLVLLVAQKLPFSGWYLKRTSLPYVAVVVLWVVLIISLASWWNNIYKPLWF